MSTPTPRMAELWKMYGDGKIELITVAAEGEEIESDLIATQTELTAANARIAELEKQNTEFRGMIDRRNEQIADIQAQLASAREDALDLDFLERSIKNSFHDPEFQFIELKEGPLYDHIRLVMYNGRTTVAYEGGGSIRVAIRKARGVTCKTCEGLGVVGYTIGQTPESFEQGEYPCPDCSPPAVAETGEKDAWLPIETAPKDGTMVLLFGTRREGEIKLIAFGYHGKWNLPHGDEDWLVDYGRFTPTHWQPVPPPPQGKERE